ncbi:hypothetical protein BV20DRAFT_961896 [Pilatotrama ljubarskyi]|nr:hypothetical protein BV20DRAFT_961896 [Pilatotrama ljubarskyi]
MQVTGLDSQITSVAAQVSTQKEYITLLTKQHAQSAGKIGNIDNAKGMKTESENKLKEDLDALPPVDPGRPVRTALDRPKLKLDTRDANEPLMRPTLPGLKEDILAAASSSDTASQLRSPPAGGSPPELAGMSRADETVLQPISSLDDPEVLSAESELPWSARTWRVRILQVP